MPNLFEMLICRWLMYENLNEVHTIGVVVSLFVFRSKHSWDKFRKLILHLLNCYNFVWFFYTTSIDSKLNLVWLCHNRPDCIDKITNQLLIQWSIKQRKPAIIATLHRIKMFSWIKSNRLCFADPSSTGLALKRGKHTYGNQARN